MASANPIRLLDTVERALHENGLAGRPVLVAASGGLDSTVLAVAMAAHASALGIALSLGHVNHGLRGRESELDAEFVAKLAASLGARFASRQVDPMALREGGSSRARPTLQEAARRLRYEALEQMAFEAEGAIIATAHHADDQMETVLLRLLRGCGPDGLGGIPERSPDGRLVRPLLAASRRDIEAFAAARSLDWREDRSNRDLHYARNRLRHEWIPRLADEFNPQLLRALTNLAEAQRRDSEWLGSLVEVEARRRFRRVGRALEISLEGWMELPQGLARRLARKALSEVGSGREVSSAHLGRVLRLFEAGKSGVEIELPAGLRLLCRGGDAVLRSSGVDDRTAC